MLKVRKRKRMRKAGKIILISVFVAILFVGLYYAYLKYREILLAGIFIMFYVGSAIYIGNALGDLFYEATKNHFDRIKELEDLVEEIFKDYISDNQDNVDRPDVVEPS